MRPEAEEIKKRLRHREDMFLRRLFGMLAKMAKSDGRVDAWEAHAAEKAFERFPRAAERRKFCIRVFNESKNSRISLGKMAVEFANRWASPEDCLAAYEILWDIACSTGVLRQIHKSNLDSLCRFLKLPESYFGIFHRRRMGSVREEAEQKREGSRKEPRQNRRERTKKNGWFDESFFREWFWNDASEHQKPPPKPKPKTELQKALEMIGANERSTPDELRHAYRATAKRLHPDMVRAQGGTEAEVKDATRKMSRLNSAWELIRESRGI